MLVLSRKPNERIRVKCPDGSILWITLVRTFPQGARLGVSAPPEFQIVREELIPPEEKGGAK